MIFEISKLEGNLSGICFDKGEKHYSNPQKPFPFNMSWYKHFSKSVQHLILVILMDAFHDYCCSKLLVQSRKTGATLQLVQKKLKFLPLSVNCHIFACLRDVFLIFVSFFAGLVCYVMSVSNLSNV